MITALRMSTYHYLSHRLFNMGAYFLFQVTAGVEVPSLQDAPVRTMPLQSPSQQPLKHPGNFL